jgi:hypothetical protein
MAAPFFFAINTIEVQITNSMHVETITTLIMKQANEGGYNHHQMNHLGYMMSFHF